MPDDQEVVPSACLLLGRDEKSVGDTAWDQRYDVDNAITLGSMALFVRRSTAEV